MSINYEYKLKKEYQQIIDAILKKEQLSCPNTIDIIGLHGSLKTGDCYDKSDLDLTIVINNDKGLILSKCFIIKDLDIGFDIYMTKWDNLTSVVEYNSPYLSKLIDNEIIYYRNIECLNKFKNLEQDCLNNIKNITNQDILNRIKTNLYEGTYYYYKALNQDEYFYHYVSNVINRIIYCLMFNKRAYFKYGVKRNLEELWNLYPDNYIVNLINQIIISNNKDKILSDLKLMIDYIDNLLSNPNKEKPSIDNLSGTYEEIYSNWRNKIIQGGINNHYYEVLMNLSSTQNMLDEIYHDIDINKINLFKDYDPNNIFTNIDNLLSLYLNEYHKINLKPNVYNNIEEFIKDYLKDK